jgi:hypothetical protein
VCYSEYLLGVDAFRFFLDFLSLFQPGQKRSHSNFIATLLFIMSRYHASIITLLSLLVIVSIHEISGALTEHERLEERDKRYSREWPPTKVTPDTDGWRKLTLERLRQVAEIDDLDRRYEGYMQTVMSGFVVQNFTEFGFGLARGPEQLSSDLRDAIRGGLERGEARLEHEVEVIEGPRCLFIDRPDLTQRVRCLFNIRMRYVLGTDLVSTRIIYSNSVQVLDELQAYTEAWAGLPLTPAQA